MILRIELLCVLLVLTWSGPLPGQSILRVDMEQAVQYGLENHRRIKNEETNRTYSAWQTKADRSEYLPVVRASADYRYNADLPVSILPGDAFGQPSDQPLEIRMGTRNALQTGINLEQAIYDPVLFSGIRKSEIRESLAEVQLDDVRIQVALDIVQAYYEAVLQYDVLHTAQDRLTLYDSLERMVWKGTQNGMISERQLDEIRSKKDIQKLETDIMKLRFANALETLKMAMDYPREEELRLVDTAVLLLGVNVPLFKDSLLNYREVPDYRELELQQKLNSENISTIKRQYQPVLKGYAFVGADYYDASFQPFSNGDRWYPYSYLGVKLSLPVFEGLQRSRQQQALEVRDKVFEQRRRKLQDDLEARAGILRQEMVIARKEANQAKNEYKLYEGRLTYRIQSFQTGLVDYEQVLLTELEMDRAYQSYIRALVAVLNARIQYERLTAVHAM